MWPRRDDNMARHRRYFNRNCRPNWDGVPKWRPTWEGQNDPPVTTTSFNSVVVSESKMSCLRTSVPSTTALFFSKVPGNQQQPQFPSKSPQIESPIFSRVCFIPPGTVYDTQHSRPHFVFSRKRNSSLSPPPFHARHDLQNPGNLNPKPNDLN